MSEVSQGGTTVRIAAARPGFGAADEVFEAVVRFRAAGISVLLVEQYVHRALAVADRVAVLAKGEVVFSGSAADLAADDLAGRYLGEAAVS